MILQPEYKRDMHKNYLILKEKNEEEKESYDMRMVSNNHIPGLLKVKLRTVDQKKEYCYDITAKQPVSVMFRKEPLREEQIKEILTEIISTLKKGKEYLLFEDNFILLPDYIYMGLEEGEIELLYFSGYGKSIKEQIISLIEYMMDKVDYQDKPAVFLVYGIYKISREEECTFEKLLEFLREDEKLEKEIERQEKEERDIWMEEEKVADMEVEIESEEEKKKYPLWVWAASGASVVVALLAIIIVVRSGILFDVVTGKLLLGKMAAVFGIIGGVEAYCLTRILDEKNQIAYIAEKTEYIKPVEEKRKLERQRKECERGCFTFTEQKELEVSIENNRENQDLATVVLAEREEEYYLSPEEPDIYMPIFFPEFPFFIGTLKTKVDCVINSRNVSRFHAKFEKEKEIFYLVDLNSTNGTFLNGIRLAANESREIVLGDYVSFADVTYQFRKR